jgi:hypothetical protein
LILRGIVVAIALAGAPWFNPWSAPLQNPGFEAPDGLHLGAPRNWFTLGAGSARLDLTDPHEGRRSVRLERDPQASAFGVGQSMTATRFRGRVVRVRAWMRAEALERPAELWVRSDGGHDEPDTFVATAFAATPEWRPVEVLSEIDPAADRLAIGASVSSAGSLWLDSVSIELVAPGEAVPPSGAARDYIDEAIARIRESALDASRVDWDAARRRSWIFAAGATTPAEARPAVGFLIRSLKDGHSRLLTPSARGEIAHSGTEGSFGLASEVVRGTGYLRIAGFDAANVPADRAFAAELGRRIDEVAARQPCGWILDLREDTGGNMFAMVGGLEPFLGVGDLGFFVRGGERRPWSARDFYSQAREDLPRTPPAFGDASVALLIGERTASAGESIAVAFRGRAHTRIFGQPTAGLSTVNQGFALSDGSMAMLTVAVLADRNGNVYGSRIEPDERVGPAGYFDLRLEDQPVVKRAAEWLSASACRSPAR